MTPIYFPFTIISERVCRQIRFLFDGVVLYQPGDTAIPEPMQKLTAEGMITIRVPEQTGVGELKSALAAFTRFAHLHGEDAGSVFGSNQDRVPFFSDESISCLRGRIKSDRNGSPETGDSLFRARLFLLLAQEYDMQNTSVHMDLSRIGKMESDLLAEIRVPDEHEQDLNLPPRIPPADRGQGYMIAERIQAWSRLASRDAAISDTFLTPSEDAFESFIEAAGQVETLFESEPVSLDSPTPELKDRLAVFIQDALEGKKPDRQSLENAIAAGKKEGGQGDDTFRYSIARIPGKRGEDYLHLLLKGSDRQAFRRTQADLSRNLVVVKVMAVNEHKPSLSFNL